MSTEDTKTSLAAETARLKARIDELESELRSKSSGKESKSHQERDKLLHDVPEKANRVAHALAHAFAENLRSTADVINAVADEAFKRKEERSAKDERLDEMRLVELEGDLASVLNKGLEKSLDTPRRVVDKFYEVYQEPVRKQA